jgi:uncharacterized membrane protein
MSKLKVFKKSQNNTGSIQGFDIELNSDKLNRIDRLVDDYEKSILTGLDSKYIIKTKWSDRLADNIASFAGSWKFIILFSVFLLIWVLWNSLPLISSHFDPHPYILLNLCLSFVAAFQAPIIIMSQNRQAAREKHESIIDFAINYKAEQEIDDMQSHLHRIEAEFKELRQMLSELHSVK